jgi:hypothetical protein
MNIIFKSLLISVLTGILDFNHLFCIGPFFVSVIVLFNIFLNKWTLVRAQTLN